MAARWCAGGGTARAQTRAARAWRLPGSRGATRRVAQARTPVRPREGRNGAPPATHSPLLACTQIEGLKADGSRARLPLKSACARGSFAQREQDKCSRAPQPPPQRQPGGAPGAGIAAAAGGAGAGASRRPLSSGRPRARVAAAALGVKLPTWLQPARARQRASADASPLAPRFAAASSARGI